MTYVEKLKDPRWQKKRLEIFERDNWTCQRCKNTSETLCVHHLRYYQKRDPWDYENRHLTTLCSNCHEYETFHRKAFEDALLIVLRERGYFNDDLMKIIEGFVKNGKRKNVTK